jgi:hypothetical protein
MNLAQLCEEAHTSCMESPNQTELSPEEEAFQDSLRQDADEYESDLWDEDEDED